MAAQSEPPVGLEASLMVLSGRSFFSFAGTLEMVLSERQGTTDSVAYKESSSKDLHIMSLSVKTKNKKGDDERKSTLQCFPNTAVALNLSIMRSRHGPRNQANYSQPVTANSIPQPPTAFSDL